MKKLLSVLFLLLLTISASAATKKLFLTGGQSNTDGRLYAETLPSYLQLANANALVSYHAPYSEGRLGVFYPYFPTSDGTGQPDRWAYDAVTYYYIGQALNETFYVAKTSYGGTSIDPSVSNSGGTVNDKPFVGGYGSGYHWSADPTFLAATGIAGTNFVKDETTYTGQSLLKAWIANIDAAIDAIEAQGDEVDIKAIIWHQGESDKNAAGSYYNNLKAMVAYVRNHLVTKTGESKYATLPFFCGTIPHASSLCNSTVEKAFFTLEDEDANFHVIDLRDLTMLSDTKHFDAPSAELFGKRLYNRMIDEGVITGDKLDVEYAQVDYSDFGTDEFVGETKIWTFGDYSGPYQFSTSIYDNLYLHSNNMSGRAFESASTDIGSVTFADGTELAVTKTLGPKTGANGWTAVSIGDTDNASKNRQVAVAVNTLYPGRFSIMLTSPNATSESTKTIQLIFNGKVVAEKSLTSTDATEIYYDATVAGTYYLYSNDKFKMYAVRYVPTTDHTSQRTIITDADGYATFGNITGANLGLPAGLTAWAVAPSAESNSMVEMTQLLGVDKNTGVILQGAPSTEYKLPFVWTAQNYEGENAMTAQQTTGYVEETSGEDFVNYTFANKKFTKVSTPVSVAAGKAYLSISNGAAQCDYSELTFDEPEADAATDCGRNFNTQVVVGSEIIWDLAECTLPDYTIVGEKNGLYYYSGVSTSTRKWSVGSKSQTLKYSDNVEVACTKYFTHSVNSANTVNPLSITSSVLAGDGYTQDYIAINALYPGTFYVLFSSQNASERTIPMYFNGEKVAEVTSASSNDIKELKYTSTVAGTFLVDGRLTCNVYSARFVPSEDKMSLRQATMSSQGYAVFTNLALAPLTLPEGLKAYALQAGDIDDDAVKKVEATVIGKGEAVLLKGTASETYTMTIDNTKTSDVDAENYLQPMLAWNKPLANNTETGNAQYIFNGTRFNKADGKTKVYQGEAILSVPAGDAMAAYSVVKLAPSAVAYDFVDVYTKFGNDEVVWKETTWLCQNFGFPSSYSSDYSKATGCNNGMYYTKGATSNRSWKSGSQGAGIYQFADGTSVTVTSTARSNGASPVVTPTYSQTASASISCDFAINAAVPGKFSLLKSGGGTGSLYFNGTKVADLTTTDDSDMKELSYTSTTSGTFVYVSGSTSNVAALRFVPTDNTSIYNRVTPIGWGSMSLPYPAVVPDDACVYYVSDYEDGEDTGTITLTKVDAGGIIPAKQGFLFNSVKGLYRFEKSMTPDSWNDNMLIGTADAELTGYNYASATDPIYVLASIDENTVGFKKYTGTSIAQYKAYLQLESAITARAFKFAFDGETDGVETLVKEKANPSSSAVYSVSGKRLSAMGKGVHLVRTTDGTVIKVLK